MPADLTELPNDTIQAKALIELFGHQWTPEEFFEKFKVGNFAAIEALKKEIMDMKSKGNDATAELIFHEFAQVTALKDCLECFQLAV